MPLVYIENVGRIGIITDVKSHELPPEAWSGGQNMRFANNVAEKMQGEATVFGTPTVPPHWLLPWQRTTGAFRWIYASTAKIYYTDGTTHFDITRVSGDYTAGSRPIWSGGILHGVPILNHDNITDKPQQWDGGAAKLKDLDTWPDDTYTQIIRVFRNFLVAFDVTKVATRFPYLVKWSHPADPGAVPVTWDETDATKLAGEQTIAQSGGFIVDAHPLNDLMVIYKEDAIWTMQFIGGVFVFSFKENSQTIGALAPRCVQSFYRRDFLVGTNDIIMFDGLTPQSVINKRMRNYFFKNISSDFLPYTFVVANHAEREMWVCYVEQGATFCNKALIWNYADQTWTIRDLPDVTHISLGPVTEVATDTFNASRGSYTVTTVSWLSSVATFTLDSVDGLNVGDPITITGVIPTGYNVANVTVDSISSLDITVVVASDPGSYTSGGIVEKDAPWRFDEETTQFGESSLNISELELLMARADGTTDKFYKGNKDFTFDGAKYVSYLERTGLTVVGRDRQGNPKTDPSSVKFVRALYPKITSSPGATINIFVGAHDTPDGPITYEGPLAFNPDTDVRVDCRVQGKFIAVRFEDASTTVPWSLSGYGLDLDIVASL